MSKPDFIKREKEKGRASRMPFVNLPREVVNSPGWAALSPHGVKLLIDLASQYYGPNNGDLCAPWSRMRKRGWRSQDTLNKAKRELLNGGWIVCTRQGMLLHIATLYAITWQPINECNGKLDVQPSRIASHLWKNSDSIRQPYKTIRGADQCEQILAKAA